MDVSEWRLIIFEPSDQKKAFTAPPEFQNPTTSPPALIPVAKTLSAPPCEAPEGKPRLSFFLSMTAPGVVRNARHDPPLSPKYEGPQTPITLPASLTPVA